jgi:ribosomal protein S18 acetylase RimI-like enzyme
LATIRAPTSLLIRPATTGDYEAFARLFPELGIDDPVPGRDAWTSFLASGTRVAERDATIIAYCFCQEYGDAGYVRHIAVAPEARRGGVGRALMLAVAEGLRDSGKTTWALNVKQDNVAALRLYESLGMRTKYTATALRFPWASLDQLPSGSATVRVFGAERDARLEAQFALPRGQLASARGIGRILLEARTGDAEESAGFCVFDPKFPGAFPSRIADLSALSPLLRAMREYVPADEVVNLVVEDDARLAKLLTDCGAWVRMETAHMVGSL